MSRTLSSVWTFTFKFLFPACWIPLFGFVAVEVFRHPEEIVYNGVRGAAPAGAARVFVFAWVAGTAFLLWQCAPLERVRVDGGALVISNYLREWRVPFSAVTDVRQNRWINVRPITIR